VSINLPTLRDRGDDVLVLARHFLREFARKFQKRFQDVSPEAAERLLGYSWPGNVRELRNLIERVVLLEEGETLIAEHLPSEFSGARAVTSVTLLHPRAGWPVAGSRMW